MPFHLILPGLLWPQKALRDTAHDLPLPNLSWLLGRGRVHWGTTSALEDWLCRELAGCHENEPAPAAAVRLLGEGGSPGADIWLCADPVHVRIEQGRAHLSGDELEVTPEEMQQITGVLADCLAEVGDFQSGVRGHGYLRLHQRPLLVTTPPSAAAGRGNLLPSGPDAPRWLRLGNEAQMLLHGLPLNARREAEGRPTLNSLWFWGAGCLPVANPPPTGRHAHLIGNDPILKGLADLASSAHSLDAPDVPALLGSSPSLLLLKDLQQPAQGLDANRWREALVAVESRWLKPLAQALRIGRLDALRITALGDEGSVEVTVRRLDTLKLWRRPRALHELGLLSP